MTRRIVLTLTALAVLGTGAGAASAATSNHASTNGVRVADGDPHQLCVLFYRNNNPTPQHLCVNW
ncbi:MAG: hypothetical protein ACJ735_02695 [Actinomycetes bacterium]